MDTPMLRQLLDAFSQHTLPDAMRAATARIARERAWVEELLKDERGGSIYGFNTELGHRDFVTVKARAENDLQRAIFASHDISPTQALGVYPRHIAALIGCVKVFQLSHGGSGISAETYEHIIKKVTDPTFFPQIPAGQSYSSGDVLPANHWAGAVFALDSDAPYRLKQGEMIALINGNFIHTALAAGNYWELGEALKWVVVAGAYAGRVCDLDRINFIRELPGDKEAARGALDYLMRTSGDRKSRSTSPQHAVSIRAIPDVIIEFCSAHHALGREVDAMLLMPSANPLFDWQRKEVFSSPSFLAIGLALAQNKMIEALLMVLRASVARVSFILSGRVAKIPEDGLDPAAEVGLGLIQVPKEMTAVVESVYQTYGRRGFASGGATSYGIEDLWTHGEALSRDIHKLSNVVRAVMAREIAVYEVLARRYAPLRSMNLCSVNPPQSIGLIAELHFVENFLKGLETLTVEGLLD